MSEIAIIKSFKNGIKLILSPDAEFTDICSEVAKKFAEGSHFFGEATIALSITGRYLAPEEEQILVDLIGANCQLNVLCIVDDDEENNARYIKAIRQIESKYNPGEGGRFYNGSVTDGQSLFFDDSVVIIGDVNPGCLVESKGSVIVLGGLYGVVHAGQNNESDEDIFVIALEMAPEELFIRELSYIPEVKPKWGLRHKILPKIARISDGIIVFENLSKSALETNYAY